MTTANPPLTYAELGNEDEFPITRLVAVSGKQGSSRKPSRVKATIDGFAALGIQTLLDLLMFYPFRYIDRRQSVKIGDLWQGNATDEEVVVLGEVTSVIAQQNFGGRQWQRSSSKGRCRVEIDDGTGKLQCTFFNQPWRANQLSEGMQVHLFGKVKWFRGAPSMANPLVDPIGDKVGKIVALYRQSAQAKQHSIDTRKVNECIEEVLKRAEQRGFSDPIPAEVRKEHSLITRDYALRWIHEPDDFPQMTLARNRLVFDELFRMQTWLFRRRERIRRESRGIPHEPNEEFLQAYYRSLPFKMTAAQQRAINEITEDLAKPWPMQRLLQGEVGSGKTAVGIVAMLVAAGGGHQAAIMAPTEVLAEQIYFTTKTYLDRCVDADGQSRLKVPDQGTLSGERELAIAILTSRTTPAKRTEMLEKLAEGTIDIIVGTHSLIQKDVVFKSLGLVVIDEQQRFGVEQRAVLQEQPGEPAPAATPAGYRTGLSDGQDDLSGQSSNTPTSVASSSRPSESQTSAVESDVDKSNRTPDLLVMTGTPIPRTTAMTVLGDLDLTELDELPSGRSAVTTKWMPAEASKMWQEVRDEIAAGRQAYVVCPTIDAPKASDRQSASSSSGEGKEKPSKTKAIKVSHRQQPQFRPRVIQASHVKQLESDFTSNVEAGVIATHARLSQRELADCSIGLLHGRLKPEEKERVMEQFRSGELDVLVATTVIEVGVDVPNATAMVIMEAQQFGLAQLHQLRGRVGRGEHQSVCFLVGEATTPEAQQRLEAMLETNDGFELAKLDVEIRGEGTIMGDKQSGRGSLLLARLQRDEEWVRKARAAAEELVLADPELADHQALAEEISVMLQEESAAFLTKT